MQNNTNGNFEQEEYVDVNDSKGLEINPRGRGKETFESLGIEYRKTFVCRRCKGEVDVNAEVCPHCGHYVSSNRRYVPISAQKAWRIKFILGIIVFAVFLVLVSMK